MLLDIISSSIVNFLFFLGIVKVIIGDYSKLDLKVMMANGKYQQFGCLLGIFNI
ncbi:hypothetical protein HMPREF9517_00540 [Enterococcus faecalis TX1341]|nr:hypothetical protein HMPREF9377_02077 [Enterococcus faecalis R712]EFE19204.1 hypothetical protein HMPREF9376_01809 [Enterococcus faecalis S613]EFQ08857.1 hypothetical protein HMPREF9492_02772 [Enterococcus faecalis DAPTO 512]EFQ66620.1 hypothetical protein HMPREF9493_02718 [Enterococcus faecalis DAPTO 516]EFU12829.1 hypothetical protein HMPREF9517_00540 [Enterococcus faecalis TX1341]BBD26492.1 hypothetical protein KUB3006_P20520 [Enterococcus faecalis]